MPPTTPTPNDWQQLYAKYQRELLEQGELIARLRTQNAQMRAALADFALRASFDGPAAFLLFTPGEPLPEEMAIETSAWAPVATWRRLRVAAALPEEQEARDGHD